MAFLVHQYPAAPQAQAQPWHPVDNRAPVSATHNLEAKIREPDTVFTRLNEGIENLRLPLQYHQDHSNVPSLQLIALQQQQQQQPQEQHNNLEGGVQQPQQEEEEQVNPSGFESGGEVEDALDFLIATLRAEKAGVVEEVGKLRAETARAVEEVGKLRARVEGKKMKRGLRRGERKGA